MKNLISALAASSALALAAPSFVHAQTKPAFPSKPVTLVVPFTPSSGSDIIARVIGPKLAEHWNQAVIVENKPGASGNIGAQHVANAEPDGHTLLMAINTFTMTPAIYKSLPYDPVADFKPVAKLAEAGFTFVVNLDVPAKDMKSLIDHVKKNAGKLNYGSPGSGTPHHLAMELFKLEFDLDVLHVPYKGLAGSLTDLVGGQTQMMFATVHSMRPLAEGGKVRQLAVTGKSRNPLAPNIPTFREQGIDVMDSIDAWYAVLAPGKTSPDLVAQLNKDFLEVMKSKDVQEQLAKQGLTVSTGTPEDLQALINSDLQRWRKVVTEAGISSD